MRAYIVNLTDNLIGKHHFDKMAETMAKDWGGFLNFVKMSLETHDVREMNPETLGKIMCSFEVGDVLANKEQLFQKIYFAGDCEAMLRDLVAVCLAFAIADRLDPEAEFGTLVPPYRPRKTIPELLAKMDKVVRRANQEVFGDNRPVRKK